MQYRLGIDLGGTAFKIGLVDENGRIVASTSAPTNQYARSFEAVVADMAAHAKALLAENGLIPSQLAGIGIGTPGCVERESGNLLFAGNFNWHNKPLRSCLETELGVSVAVGNDADCALIGEAIAGAAKGQKNVLMLTLGTGVGGGLILDGKLYSGTNGKGGELGHVPFVFDGEPCTCGAKGCLEAYASTTALLRLAKSAMAEHPDSLLHAHAEANQGEINGLAVFECAHANDAAALTALDTYTTYVAAGIAGFNNIFRPEIVLIGGGISAQGDYLIDPIRRKLSGFSFAAQYLASPPIVAATLGNDAGIIGAAYLKQMI